jgi:hypothetical protein
MSLEDFLKKYYRQLHFNSMEPEVMARLQELIQKGNLTDKMQLWVSKYMHRDADGKYKLNALPDTTSTNDLPDDVARDLFQACHQAFVGMAGARATFADSNPQARDFLDKYFGQGKMFNVSKATDACRNGIIAITNLIKTDHYVKRWLLTQTYTNEKGEQKKLFDNEEKLNEFLAKCDREEYNTKGNVQDKVKKVAEAFERATYQDLSNTRLSAITGITDHISNVTDSGAFALDQTSINAQLQAFRNNINEDQGILQVLYKNQNIRSQFAKHDNGTITSIIEGKAIDEINYQKKDSPDYIEPKVNDVLTPLQQLEKWTGDTYNDTLKKYEELRGGHLFFKAESQDICKAIDKVSDKAKNPEDKITPANGLLKLLEKSEDVKKKLGANPVARQHFEWFVETMNDVKDKIPKAIDGCWKNAEQMKCVIEQIILKATDPQNSDPHAMEKAKTAMEIMTVMKYGMLTSKVMDAMRKEEFSMFSDGKLSWNKNEGIQFVTKAFDKSVKAAFLGVGYGITFVRNKIMMSGMEFTNENNRNGALKNRMNQEHQRISSERNLATNELNSALANRTNIQNNLNALNQAGVNEQTVNGQGGLREQKEQIEQVLNQHAQARDNAAIQMEEAERRRNEAQQIMDTNQQAYQRGQDLDDILHDRDILAKVQNFQAQMQTNTDQINEINNRLNQNPLLDEQGNPITDKRAAAAYKRQLYDTLGNLYNQNRQLTAQINAENAKRGDQARHNQAAAELATIQGQIDAYNNAQTAYNAADQDYTAAENDYNNADNAYNNYAQTHNYGDISDKVNRFNDATAELTEINDTIDKKQRLLQEMTPEQQNKVVQLENFWNVLQSGKAKTWRLFTSRAQDKFNPTQVEQNYVNDYGLAA